MTPAAANRLSFRRNCAPKQQPEARAVRRLVGSWRADPRQHPRREGDPAADARRGPGDGRGGQGDPGRPLPRDEAPARHRAEQSRPARRDRGLRRGRAGRADPPQPHPRRGRRPDRARLTDPHRRRAARGGAGGRPVQAPRRHHRPGPAALRRRGGSVPGPGRRDPDRQPVRPGTGRGNNSCATTGTPTGTTTT